MYIFENSGIPNGSESVRNFLPNQKSNMPSMKVCVVHPGGEKSLGFNVFHYPPRVLTDMTREYFKVVSATSGAICKDCWKKFSHRSVDKMGQTEQPSITTMVRWFIYFCINFFLLFSFALLKADEMLVECSTGKFSTQTRQNFQEFEDNMKETNVKTPSGDNSWYPSRKELENLLQLHLEWNKEHLYQFSQACGMAYATKRFRERI